MKQKLNLMRCMVACCMCFGTLSAVADDVPQQLPLLSAKTLSIRTGGLSSTEKSTMPNRDIQYDAAGVTVSYSIEYADMKRKSDSEVINLSISGFTQMAGNGIPALPTRTDMFSLRRGENAKIDILEQQYVDYHMELTSARPIALENESITSETPIASYKGFYPLSPVEAENVQYRRDDGILFINVTPVQYDVERQVVRIYTKLEYRVSLNGTHASLAKQASLDNAERLMTDQDEDFLSATGVIPICQKSTSSVEKAPGDITSKLPGYLIIAPPSMETQARRLMQWRRATGFQTVVQYMSNPTPDAVKSIIRKAYNNEPLGLMSKQKPFKSKDLAYVLIIGDHSIIPAAEVTDTLPNGDKELIITLLSDMSYYCMDGANDVLPDVKYGRLPVKTAEEAEVVISKILNYESAYPDDTRYPSFNTAYHMAEFADTDKKSDGKEDRRFTLTAEDLRIQLQNGSNLTITPLYKYNGSMSPMYWSNSLSYSYGAPLPEYMTDGSFKWDANTNDVVSAFNARPLYIFYRGHGGNGNWATPYFSAFNVSFLNNGVGLPVVFGICCQSGMLDRNSVSRSLLIYDKGGAVAVIAASENSYSGYNDSFSYGLFKSIWQNVNFVADFPYRPSDVNYKKAVTQRLGDVVDSGQLFMFANYCFSSFTNQYYKYQRNIYNCFGDPAMKMYSKSPIRHGNNCVVTRYDSYIEIKSLDGDCTVTIYDRGTGEIVQYPSIDFLEYETTMPENVVVTMQKQDHTVFVSHGDNTSTLF